MLQAEPAVHKDGVADLDGDSHLRQLLRRAAAGPERHHALLHVGRKADGCELLSHAHKQGATFGPSVPIRPRSRRDISEVEVHIHHLMIPDQHMHHTPSLLRLFPQFGEEVYAVLLLVSTVEDVANLHKVRRTADPILVIVDEPGNLHAANKRCHIPMHISNSHDAIGGRKLPFSLNIRDIEAVRAGVAIFKEFEEHRACPAVLPYS
mmetsp:Transcript_7336/g.14578  ORF Transcript_7336/g.14578 Transcript_7336/m.14578 type:complete len:207 (-) Transcript_7336:339-959(-)